MKFILKTNTIARIALSLLLVAAPFFATPRARANFQQAFLRLDRLAASIATGGTVCARPNTVGTEASVRVTFPAGFAVNTAAGNWTVTTTNLPFGASTWPGIGTGNNVTGQVVTFPSTDLTVGTLYCFNFTGTNTLTNSASGNNLNGTIETRTSVPATIDTTQYALSVVGSGADQIVVSATVPATFTFALSGNTDTFTTDLGTTTVSTNGRTVTIGTNAASGWIAWVRSANAALNSVSTGGTIATAGATDNTPSDLTAGTGYVLDVDITTDSATGTGVVSQATTSGGTLSAVYQPIAASSGTTDGDVLTLIERARVSAVQSAASDYTDTLTVVAAGRF
jgi:hypothetical protein